jgi:hypothetical protein
MGLTTPVVFIIYNRPNETLRVFEEIRKVQPRQLFIIGDGARNASDALMVQKTREIINKIDWECSLNTDFSDINIGCADRIISGLNWVFNQVEKAIILEDDCLPNSSFFSFCEEMLLRYEKDVEVMHISGFNIMGNSTIDSSYFFSKYILPPWGWATWRRAWKFQNDNLDTWQEIKTWAYQNISQNYFKDWTDMFEHIRKNRTTWDVPWNIDIWKNKGLGIIPKHSLVKNIGISENATFTKNKETELAKIDFNNLEFPLVHPTNKNTSFEREIEEKIIEGVRIFNDNKTQN